MFIAFLFFIGFDSIESEFRCLSKFAFQKGFVVATATSAKIISLCVLEQRLARSEACFQGSLGI